MAREVDIASQKNGAVVLDAIERHRDMTQKEVARAFTMDAKTPRRFDKNAHALRTVQSPFYARKVCDISRAFHADCGSSFVVGGRSAECPEGSAVHGGRPMGHKEHVLTFVALLASIPSLADVLYLTDGRCLRGIEYRERSPWCLFTIDSGKRV